jgi:hypothetical protein
MRFHHQPERCENDSRLVALVAAADHMANHLQLGEAVDTYIPEDNAALDHLWSGWSETRKERLLDQIPSFMEEAVQAAAGEVTA